jgi:hypothetical protein
VVPELLLELRAERRLELAQHVENRLLQRQRGAQLVREELSRALDRPETRRPLSRRRETGTESARLRHEALPRTCCDGAVAKLTREQARAIAHALELDLDEVDICLACLSFVAFPLRTGDDREVRRALASVTPHLWEGLALPAVAALERARRAGVPHAEAALADITTHGSSSHVVREIVLRLAAELGQRR